jgi:hypothetical protein
MTEHSSRQSISRRAVLAAVPGSLLSASLYGGPATQPATKPADGKEAQIRALAAYYAKIYGEPLASPERLPRHIAIVSLSRIDAPETTAKLIEVFKRDRDPVIWYLAWEALHARVGSLSSEERRHWVTGGLQAANMQGGFPGITVTPLLRAMAEHSMVAYEDQPYRLAMRVVRENGLDDPEQKAALNALSRLVAAWHDGGMVRTLIGLAGRPELAPRVDHVLRRLPDPPAEGPANRVQAAWSAWLDRAKLKPAAPNELPRYKAEQGSTVFAAPDVITDPNDKRWYAQLEPGKLTVTDFDLAWAIDSTGSMNEENQRVAAETGLVARVCSLVSRRARCGAVYARHEIDSKFTKPCCQSAGSNPAWYQVKPHALTADVKALSTAMAAERIPKPNAAVEGNVHPGTPVLGAMQGAVARLKWSQDKQARKVIVLVGDSTLTPGTEQAAVQFAARCKDEGFQIHALATGKANMAWQDVLKSAGGSILPFNAGGGGAAAGGPPMPARPRARRNGGNVSEGSISVFGQLATRVIQDSVAAGYRDRVTPLVKVLLHYAEAARDAEAETAGQ